MKASFKEAGPSWRQITLLAFAVGTSTGLLDTILGYLHGTATELAPFLPFLGTVAAVTCSSYLLAWFLVLAPVGRRQQLDPWSLAVSLGAFLLGTEIGVAIVRWDQGFSIPVGLGWAPILGACVAILSYRSLQSKQSLRSMTSGQVLLLPIIAALTLCLLWLLKQSFLEESRLQLLAFAGYAVASVVCSRFFQRTRSSAATVLAIAGLIALCLAGLFLPSAATREAYEKPGGEQHPSTNRIILITIDTLRPDFLSSYSEAALPTPGIDSLAGDGVLFSRAYSPSPWTLPSVASMMTGVSPLVHRAITRESVVPKSLPTLAEKLLAAGYRTAAIGENPFLRVQSGLGRGFEEYEFFPRPVPNTPVGWLLWRAAAPYSVLQELGAERLNNLAVEWVQRHSQEDFFLWLHFFDVHLPYAPPARYLAGARPPEGMELEWNDLSAVRTGNWVPSREQQQWIKRLYAAEVRRVDDAVGSFLSTLKSLGLYDDSLIVVTSDHGEEFWEHEGFEHGHSVHEEVIRVPLLIKAPQQHEAVRFSEPVSTESLMPTILSYCGVGYEAKSLTSSALLDNESAIAPGTAQREIVSTGLLYFQNRLALIEPPLKYVRYEATGREVLYDLAKDPQEMAPLFAADGGALDQLRQRFNEVVRGAKSVSAAYGISAGDRPPLDERFREMLRSLGYVE